MDRWVGKVAVVTGASAGIGAAVCKRLAEEGLQVIGIARRVEKVEVLAETCRGPGIIHPVKCDVTKQEDIAKTFEWIKKNIGPVQILINNAGICRNGKIIDGNPDDWKNVLDTNLLGLSICSKEAFQQMKEADVPGHIIHINSIGGHFVLAGGGSHYLNMYSPSKHAVTCVTEIMRKEITHCKANVKVTSLSPGLVKTEIMEAANSKNPEEVYTRPYLQPEDIGDSIVYLLSTPPHVQIQELMIRPVGEDF